MELHAKVIPMVTKYGDS